MRTAFCFSGELRSIDKTYDILKERLFYAFSNYDIFYHTWSDDPDLHKLHFIENDSHTKNISVEDRITLHEREIYQKNKRNEVFIQGLLRQLYCLKKCNEMKSKFEIDNNFKYDIVVRIRPDILILGDSFLEENVESWDMEKYIYVADHDDHHGYNDRFYFSNSQNMDFISNRLDLIDYYMDIGGVFHYETFFKFCVHYRNLLVCRSDIEFALLRTDETLSGELVDKYINV